MTVDERLEGIEQKLDTIINMITAQPVQKASTVTSSDRKRNRTTYPMYTLVKELSDQSMAEKEIERWTKVKYTTVRKYLGLTEVEVKAKYDKWVSEGKPEDIMVTEARARLAVGNPDAVEPLPPSGPIVAVQTSTEVTEATPQQLAQVNPMALVVNGQASNMAEAEYLAARTAADLGVTPAYDIDTGEIEDEYVDITELGAMEIPEAPTQQIPPPPVQQVQPALQPQLVICPPTPNGPGWFEWTPELAQAAEQYKMPDGFPVYYPVNPDDIIVVMFVNEALGVSTPARARDIDWTPGGGVTRWAKVNMPGV